MSQPTMDKYADLWVLCASQQIELGVEFGAAAMECMSKVYDLDSNFVRREMGNAILLVKQCVDARTPIEAASLVAERWRAEMQEGAKFTQQLGELLGNATIKLNHSVQRHAIEVNKQCTSCLQGVASHRAASNGDLTHLLDKSMHELPGMLGKMFESGKQISDAWSNGIQQVVPQILAATALPSESTSRKPAAKGTKAES